MHDAKNAIFGQIIVRWLNFQREPMAILWLSAFLLTDNEKRILFLGSAEPLRNVFRFLAWFRDGCPIGAERSAELHRLRTMTGRRRFVGCLSEPVRHREPGARVSGGGRGRGPSVRWLGGCGRRGGGAVRGGQSIAQRTNWHPEKRKTEKKKKGMQNRGRKQSATQGFLEKILFSSEARKGRFFSKTRRA